MQISPLFGSVLRISQAQYDNSNFKDIPLRHMLGKSAEESNDTLLFINDASGSDYDRLEQFYASDSTSENLLSGNPVSPEEMAAWNTKRNAFYDAELPKATDATGWSIEKLLEFLEKAPQRLAEHLAKQA